MVAFEARPQLRIE